MGCRLTPVSAPVMKPVNLLDDACRCNAHGVGYGKSHVGVVAIAPLPQSVVQIMRDRFCRLGNLELPPPLTNVVSDYGSEYERWRLALQRFADSDNTMAGRVTGRVLSQQDRDQTVEYADNLDASYQEMKAVIQSSLDRLSFDCVWEEIGQPESLQAWNRCYQTLGAHFRHLEALGAAIVEVHGELDAARIRGLHASHSLSEGGDREDVVPLLPDVVSRWIVLHGSQK